MTEEDCIPLSIKYPTKSVVLSSHNLGITSRFTRNLLNCLHMFKYVLFVEDLFWLYRQLVMILFKLEDAELEVVEDSVFLLFLFFLSAIELFNS